MTTVISRLYKDKKAADTVVKALHEVGFPDNIIDVINAGDKDAEAAMVAARVAKDAAATYAGELGDSASLVVVRAPFTPFGAAREAMKIVDGHSPMASAVSDQNMMIREQPRSDLFLSVMRDHRLFMTDRKEMSRNDGRISHGFGWRLLSKHKTGRSAMSGGRFMSKMFWPMPLLSRKKDKLSVYRGGKKFLTS